MFAIRLPRLPATRLIGALALFAGVLASPLVQGAERLPAGDAQAIRQVIRDQIDAFGRDDATRAFRYATSDIQKRFRTADNFMRMVRENYQPVYRADSVHFARLKRVDGQWVQSVQVVDDAGHVWDALFTMKRQGKGGWKVAGCELVETTTFAT